MAAVPSIPQNPSAEFTPLLETLTGTYSVSGIVVDSDGNGIEDVTLAFFKGFGTAKTNSAGEWRKNGLRGTVKISPSKDGYVFAPSSCEVSVPSDSVYFTGSNSVAAKGRMKVSFVGNTEPRVQSRVTMDDLTPFDPSVYAPPFNNELKGNLVGNYTPHSVIGSIFGMGVASPNYRLPLSLTYGVATGPSSGFGLLPVFDLALAKDIIYADYLLEHGRYDFTVVEMHIWTHDYDGENWTTFPPLSQVYIDLGDKYSDVSFPNELRDKSHGTVHVFQLADLIPLGKKDQIGSVRLAFDHTVDRPYIVNPDGSYVSDFNPYFWDCGTRIGLAGYVIYLPGLDLDLSSESAHLIFDWDLFELIEVYDNGTPDDVTDDLITLRLDNPFPITLRAEPYGEWEPISGDGMPPPDVSKLDIRFFDIIDQQVFVSWINPSVHDFRQTHVIRKEGTPPNGFEDGELVCVGTEALYQDDDIELSKEYFYRVIVEDWDGLFSNGEVISIRTDPWIFTTIRVVADPESVSIGETVDLYAGGYITQSDLLYDAACQWKLDGDIGGLTYDLDNFSATLDEPGCHCRFKATKPGTGVITATKNDLSASVTITVTE